MKTMIEKAERFLEFGGIKKEIVFLILSGIALIISMFDLLPLPFDAAWIAIILCGIPIILEAIIGLITAFDNQIFHYDLLAAYALPALSKAYSVFSFLLVLRIKPMITAANTATAASPARAAPTFKVSGAVIRVPMV